MFVSDQFQQNYAAPVVTQAKKSDLSGQHILYVGGRTRQMAKFRKIIKEKGGTFVHHDGGLHDGFPRLKKMVACADAVMCPVDCLGHNACNQIKKFCKQAGKPLVFLRTSGLSAFNEGVESMQMAFLIEG